MDNLKEWSESIKNSLTIEQIKDLLYALGGDPQLKEDYIISRTICHGGHQHKLFYYDNTKLFRCYTECSDTFDIYDLIIKNKKNEGIDFTLYKAIQFVITFFNLTISTENFSFDNEEISDWRILNKYEQNSSQEKQEKIIEFKFYDNKILKYLPRPKIPIWLREGISQEAMNNCGIAFDPVSWGIVIPHYNIDGKLIGIRERTLIKEEENNGKYKPAILNYQMYNHPLGFNLYNLNNSKDNIRKIKKAIIFEGEKSCLLYQSYFGIDNDISVAVCGSNLTNYQVQLLKNLDVDEIVIAFDKQFKEIGDNEFKGWVKKLKDINKKFSSIISISFAFDKWNLLGYKDSPIDCRTWNFYTTFWKENNDIMNIYNWDNDKLIFAKQWIDTLLNLYFIRKEMPILYEWIWNI